MKANDNKPRLNLVLRLFLIVNIVCSLGLLAAYMAVHVSPNTVIYFSYFGLSYSVWLSVELAFILFWLVFKKRWAFVSIITILLGISHLGDFYAFNLSDKELVDPIKVVSYNVKIFNLYELENRIEKRNNMFTFLKEENADIFCFQEFYHDTKGKGFVTKDSLVQLIETPYEHERYTHEMRDKRYFGVATFSKYPIINKGEIAFENDVNNFCIYSDLVIKNDTVRVFNAHIGSIRFQNDDYQFFSQATTGDSYSNNEAGQRILLRLKSAFKKRAVQAEQVAKEIALSPYPVIFCGDLNDTPVSYCYRQFSRLLVDSFIASGNGIGTTYIGEVPSNRIDYIFHSAAFKSANFKTHPYDYSDHKPISCELEIFRTE